MNMYSVFSFKDLIFFSQHNDTRGVKNLGHIFLLECLSKTTSLPHKGRNKYIVCCCSHHAATTNEKLMGLHEYVVVHTMSRLLMKNLCISIRLDDCHL